ncbi:MAG: hypothetical protein D6730_25020 [Bacteroidetes bacterium]|nr:MAG: hypothetical protein D6730_25020 [Bacteroidota bacterium]
MLQTRSLHFPSIAITLLALLLIIWAVGYFFFSYQNFRQAQAYTVEVSGQMQTAQINQLMQLIDHKITAQTAGTWASLLTAVVAGLLGIYGGYLKATEKARELVHTHIADTINRNREAIARAIDWADLELQLIRDSRILLLTQVEARERNKHPMETFFRMLGIAPVPRHFPVEGPPEQQDLPRLRKAIEQADLVFFNDENKRFTPYLEAYLSLVEVGPEKRAIFYYGRGRVDTEHMDATQKTLLSYANTPSQIYGNLLNLLKTQRLMRQHSP